MQNIVEAQVQFQFLLHDGHEDAGADGSPDWGLHGVLGVAVERLNSQVLFDPFEEQFDWPAAAMEFRDGQRGECEVVRQEHKPAVVFGSTASRNRTRAS